MSNDDDNDAGESPAPVFVHFLFQNNVIRISRRKRTTACR